MRPQPITDLILKAYNELGKGKNTLTLDIWEKIQNDPLMADKTQREGLSTIGKRLRTNNKPYKINPGGAGESMRKRLLRERRTYVEAAKDVTKPTIVFKDGKVMNVTFPKDGPLSEANFVKTLKKYYETPQDISGKLSKQRNKIIKDFKITPGTATFHRIQKFIADKHNISSDRPYKYGTKYGSQQYGTAARESKTKTQSAKTFEGMVGLKKRPLAKKLLPDKAFKWGYEPLDLAHRLSLGASKKWGLQQTTSTIGLDRPVVNQVFVEHFQKKLNKIYSIQKDLIKNKPKNWRAQLESTNRMVTSIVNDADNRIVGVTVDERTLKPRLYGDRLATKWAIDQGWFDTDIKNIKKGSAQYNFIRDHLIEPQVIREAETGLDISKFRNINKEELVKWMNTKKKLNTGIKNQTLELLDKYPEITKPQGALATQTTKPQIQQILVNLVSQLKGNARKRVCGIGTKVMEGLAAGGRVGYKTAGVVDSCPIIPALEASPEQTMNELSKLRGQTGILGRIGNTAKGFLGTLGKWGPRIGKYGAIAAAGAVAQPLIKQFRNDDPSTWLTDENQQAGMLEALIEGERPKPRSEILDWGIGAGEVGATAAAVPGTSALYKVRRGVEVKIPKAGPVGPTVEAVTRYKGIVKDLEEQIADLTKASKERGIPWQRKIRIETGIDRIRSKLDKIKKAGPASPTATEGLTAGDYLKKYGKGYGPVRAGAGVGMKLLSGMFTPAGILATEPLRIAQKRREGESWGDIATDPVAWMGPAFAPSMTRMATRGMNPASFLPKLLRLGMSRAALAAMGPVGWAGLAASLGWTGYEQYQDYKKGRGFFASDEE